MGKGKGAPEYWVACIKPGTIIFEAGGVPREIAERALALAAQKLPMRTRLSVRRDLE
jgi:large subunit ribosomal protein L16